MKRLNLGQEGAPFIGMHVRAGDSCGTWRGLGGDWYLCVCSLFIWGVKVHVCQAEAPVQEDDVAVLAVSSFEALFDEV